MNRKLENDIQELALAVVNNNGERADRLIRRLPQDAIEKVARGGAELFRFALHYLPAGAAEAIRREIQEKASGAAAGKEK